MNSNFWGLDAEVKLANELFSVKERIFVKKKRQGKKAKQLLRQTAVISTIKLQVLFCT